MKIKYIDDKTHLVPLGSIKVLNPRDRNEKTFESIVESIRDVGLKKPILLAPRKTTDGQMYYLLACGEGRLNAFKILGQESIPALLIDANDEDAFLISLAENLARRGVRPLENMANIKRLADKGYSTTEIGAKTGLHQVYISGILNLLAQGEERLLVAVERGLIPLNTAIDIAYAGDNDKALQVAMQDAYESGKLRGSKLMEVRRLLERRQRLGNSMGKRGKRAQSDVTSSSLLRVYEKEVERKKLVLKKAGITNQRLMFVVSALRQLVTNENFVNLLRAESFETMPLYLAERVWPEGGLR